MTIYLLKKTHTKTGLMYLCKTVQNPFKYKGSGKDWRPHLRQYGNDHYTEIIQECHSKEEFKYWGRYYSLLWNIVNAQDDFGNKIWANQKIEGGDGGSRPNPTPESRAKRSASMKDVWANKTPEEIATHSALMKAIGANMTPEDRAKRAASRKAYCANMTPEDRAKRSALMKDVWANMTPEDRAKRSASMKDVWSNKTPEEIAKRSAARKAYRERIQLQKNN